MVMGALLSLAAATALTTSVTIPDIVEVTDIAGLAVSQDGKQVAFRTEQPSIGGNNTHIEWYVAPIDGSAAPRPVGDGGGALLDQAGVIETEPAIWSPRSDAIYYRALVDDAVQIWRAATDGSGTRPVTQDPANVRDLTASADGHAIVYHVGATRDAIATAERQSHDDGVLIDASVDINQPLINGGVVDGRIGSQRFIGSWSDRDNILWRTPPIGRSLPFGPVLDDVAAPAPSPAPRLSDSAAIESNGRRDGATVTVAGNKILCTAVLCRSGRPVWITPLNDEGDYVIGLDDIALNQTLASWRPSNQSFRPIVRGTGLLSGGRRADQPCAVGTDALLCVAAAASEPPRLVRIATRDGVPVTLFDPNAALRQRASGSSRELHWQDRSGTPFAGQLFLPRTAKPATGYPLVISYYRCDGFLRGGHGDELPLLPLAGAGVATLCVNSVVNNDTDRDREGEYAKALTGISGAIDRLASDGTIDRRRVGYWGLSFGSEVGFRLAMHTKLASAISVSSGTGDPLGWWMNGVAGRDVPEVLQRVWHIGDPERDREGWKRVSPALNVTSITAPVLIQAPEQEARYSMEYLTDATRAGHPVELWAFADEGHLKNQPCHKVSAYVRNYDWFRYWLQDYQDPAPDKQEQYRRWALLRTQRDTLAQAIDIPRP